MADELFETDGLDAAAREQKAINREESRPAGQPRLRVAQRNQVELQAFALDELLDEGHPARTVWQAVCGLDLERLLRNVKAVEGNVGRDATDPRILLALWVFATIQGVGSARQLEKLCEEHVAFRWLCGGVSVNYHLLADFRSRNAESLDELLTQLVGSLLHEGLVTLERVAQDGMRVRANAGQASFRRRPKLEHFVGQARQQVETLRQLVETAPEELTTRQRAARQRAAEDRSRRVEEALRQCQELQQKRIATKRKDRNPDTVRVSTTDPDARRMKMADGGYRPAYNVQFSTDTASGVIVGVEVTNEGTDNEQLAPMADQLRARYSKSPDEALVDGGFVSLEQIHYLEAEHQTRVLAPVREKEKKEAKGQDPYARVKGDTDATAAWRARMGTAAAAAIYRLRGQTAEWVNAVCRNFNFWRMPVRGQKKCRGVGALYALTHNLLQAVKLRSKAAAAAA